MANPHPNLDNLKPFAPGSSGNPSGSSKKARLTAALHRLLDVDGAEDAFAKVGMDEALAGVFKFWRTILDRVDGRIPEADPPEHVDLEQIARAMKAKADMLDRQVALADEKLAGEERVQGTLVEVAKLVRERLQRAQAQPDRPPPTPAGGPELAPQPPPAAQPEPPSPDPKQWILPGSFLGMGDLTVEIPDEWRQ